MRFAAQPWLWLVPLLPALWFGLRLAEARGHAGLRRLLGDRAADHVEQRRSGLLGWDRFLLLCGLFCGFLAALLCWRCNAPAKQNGFHVAEFVRFHGLRGVAGNFKLRPLCFKPGFALHQITTLSLPNEKHGLVGIALYGACPPAGQCVTAGQVRFGNMTD